MSNPSSVDSSSFSSSISGYVQQINHAFGIEPVDLSDYLSGSTQIGDITGTVNVAGSEVTTTFFKADWLVYGVNHFRPYIRGFLVILLLFYNLNQFLSMFRIHVISHSGDKGGKNNAS